jgi:hypothetical protein
MALLLLDSQLASFETLYLRNMDEILQNIFLCLSPSSLHAARQTCKRWNEFIKKRIWGSRKAREILDERLESAWLKNSPQNIAFDLWDDVFVEQNSFAMCGDWIVLGLSHVGEGGAKVVCKRTGRILHHLNHKFDLVQKKAVSSVEMTESAIVTKCGKFIFLWNKSDFTFSDRANFMEHYDKSNKLYPSELGSSQFISSGEVIALGFVTGSLQLWSCKSKRLRLLKLLPLYIFELYFYSGIVVDSTRLGIMMSGDQWTFFQNDEIEEEDKWQVLPVEYDSIEEVGHTLVELNPFLNVLTYPHLISLQGGEMVSLTIWDIFQSQKIVKVLFDQLLMNSVELSLVVKNNLIYVIQQEEAESNLIACRLDDIMKEFPCKTEKAESLKFSKSKIKTRNSKLAVYSTFYRLKWLVDKTCLFTVDNDTIFLYDFWSGY